MCVSHVRSKMCQDQDMNGVVRLSGMSPQMPCQNGYSGEDQCNIYALNYFKENL
jgi:hypothetical protein